MNVLALEQKRKMILKRIENTRKAIIEECQKMKMLQRELQKIEYELRKYGY